MVEPRPPANLEQLTAYQIDVQLRLTDEEKSRLIFHSVVNLLNVLQELIGIVRVCLNNHSEPFFQRSLEFCALVGRSLATPQQMFQILRRLPRFCEDFKLEVEMVRHLFDPSLIDPQDFVAKSLYAKFTKTLSTLENWVVPIFELRAGELLQRVLLPAEAWVAFRKDTIRANVEQTLSAIGYNTNTISRVVFDPAQATPSDHLVLLEFDGQTPDTIRLPPVMQDCFRDLILPSLPPQVEGRRFWDRASEVEHIIQFGVRGSNAIHRRQMGGGFGRPAYYFTRHFRGTFTIYTTPGVGSVFQLRIPVPPLEAPSANISEETLPRPFSPGSQSASPQRRTPPRTASPQRRTPPPAPQGTPPPKSPAKPSAVKR
ncbi:hypothetical protein PAPYR_3174 [Paratrimastix pyriformis]|uniref:Uncharacterized protein n=1 Tax=Paratrimastix pyriformis TaxID=342808 RepID=A0ABQ8UQI3_9EUKA|nr:hypothetical protein PAPYR_3174 [Paratrimastix pyriformis]